MSHQELIELVNQLTTLKENILSFNDFLLLNINTNTYVKISEFLINKIQEINNIIEKLNEMDILVSEYNVDCNI